MKAKKDQWVPLDPELQESLEALPRTDARFFHFLNKRRQGELSAIGVSKMVRYLAKRAGVRLNFNRLRKGFGCYHASRVPAKVLQKLMRHTNIGMTMKYYANVDVAVEDAIFGSQRNSSRSRQPDRAGEQAQQIDATSYPDGSNNSRFDKFLVDGKLLP